MITTAIIAFLVVRLRRILAARRQMAASAGSESHSLRDARPPAEARVA